MDRSGSSLDGDNATTPWGINPIPKGVIPITPPPPRPIAMEVDVDTQGKLQDSQGDVEMGDVQPNSLATTLSEGHTPNLTTAQDMLSNIMECKLTSQKQKDQAWK